MQKEEDIFGKRHIFWQMLRNLFPQEEISTWEAIIFPNGTEENGLESAQNMITLSSDAHKLWNHGAFALKPISVSEDKMSLTLQFFWQKKQFQTMPVTSVDNVPPCTRDLDHYMEAKLANVHSEDFITSGQFFKMTTDDPVSRPLPNMALLHMQWFLQRVMGLAGAADVPPDLGDYFSDGEVSNLGLEEAGEESFLSSLSGPSVATVPDIASPPHPLLETPKHQGDEIQRFGDVQV